MHRSSTSDQSTAGRVAARRRATPPSGSSRVGAPDRVRLRAQDVPDHQHAEHHDRDPAAACAASTKSPPGRPSGRRPRRAARRRRRGSSRPRRPARRGTHPSLGRASTASGSSQSTNCCDQTLLKTGRPRPRGSRAGPAAAAAGRAAPARPTPTQASAEQRVRQQVQVRVDVARRATGTGPGRRGRRPNHAVEVAADVPERAPVDRPRRCSARRTGPSCPGTASAHRHVHRHPGGDRRRRRAIQRRPMPAGAQRQHEQRAEEEQRPELRRACRGRAARRPATGRLRAQANRPTTASPMASRSQLTVAVTSSAGASANIAASQGRRRRSARIIATVATASAPSTSALRL